MTLTTTDIERLEALERAATVCYTYIADAT